MMNVQSHLKPFGSTRFTIESWTKQADCCWSPTSSTEAMQAMPSLGVEVGLSESSRQLALSARHWLEASSSVGIVVIIDINRKRPKIILHKWELGPRSYGILTRASRPSACQTAFIETCRTDNATLVTGESGMDASILLSAIFVGH